MEVGAADQRLKALLDLNHINITVTASFSQKMTDTVSGKEYPTANGSEQIVLSFPIREDKDIADQIKESPESEAIISAIISKMKAAYTDTPAPAKSSKK